jgi:hypothetical protein
VHKLAVRSPGWPEATVLGPLTVLLGIIMGSSVALAVSLAMTGIVFLFLTEYADRVQAERVPLLIGLAWTWSLAAVAAASFYGELRMRTWRRAAQGALLLLLAALAVVYWPDS